MGYSVKQKMLVLQKVLPPSSRPVHEVSKDTGITVQTIYKWMKQLKNDGLAHDAGADTIPRLKVTLKSSRSCSRARKFRKQNTENGYGKTESTLSI